MVYHLMNNIFLSHQTSQQYFQSWLIRQISSNKQVEAGNSTGLYRRCMSCIAGPAPAVVLLTPDSCPEQAASRSTEQRVVCPAHACTSTQYTAMCYAVAHATESMHAAQAMPCKRDDGSLYSEVVSQRQQRLHPVSAVALYSAFLHPLS